MTEGFRNVPRTFCAMWDTFNVLKVNDNLDPGIDLLKLGESRVLTKVL